MYLRRVKWNCTSDILIGLMLMESMMILGLEAFFRALASVMFGAVLDKLISSVASQFWGARNVTIYDNASAVLDLDADFISRPEQASGCTDGG